MKVFGLALVVAILGACNLQLVRPDVERANVSAGLIGCPAREIQISNESYSTGSWGSWSAGCRGRSFVCSWMGREPKCTRELPSGDSVDAVLPPG